MDDALVQDVGTLVLIASVIAGVLFLVAYTLLARWWRTVTGWYLWMSSLAFTVILAYNLAALKGWITDTRPVIRLLIYAGILAVMLWRGVLLIRAQVAAYRHERVGRR